MMTRAVRCICQDENVTHEQAHDLTRRRNQILISNSDDLSRMPQQSSTTLRISGEGRLEASSGDLKASVMPRALRHDVSYDVNNDVHHIFSGVQM